MPSRIHQIDSRLSLPIAVVAKGTPLSERMSALDEDEWLRHFGSFEPLPGNFERPLALRYHGHQFQTYNAHLGDGRGFLFAQLERAPHAAARLPRA